MLVRSKNESWLRRMPKRRSLVAVIFAVLLMAGPVGAEGFAYNLAGELMSPYCPGRTLSSCPSPQAAELVQWIAMQEAAGASKDEIIEILIERHGEEILGAPPAEGITLWAYIFPVAGFIGGGGIAAFVLRRMVGGSASEDSSGASKSGSPALAPPPESTSERPAPASTDEELERLVDQELNDRE